MLGTLAIVFPIFGIIIAGWLARRFVLVDDGGMGALRAVVFFVTMPAFLFSSIAEGPPFDILGVGMVYFAACIVIFWAGLGLARGLGFPLARAAMLGINSAYGNTVMIGIPVAGSALGPAALPPLLAIIALHSAILLPLAGVLMEADAPGQDRRGSLAVIVDTFKATLRNPVIAAILCAFVWRFLALPLPGPLHEFLRLLGSAATPLALLCLGGTLPTFNLRVLGIETSLALVLKLIALPLLVWAIGRWTSLASLPLAVAVLTAAMPTGANAFLLAFRNEELIEVSAGTVLISTMLSVVTISMVLGFLV